MVTDETVPLEEDTPEKQPGRSTQAFSLPTRRPGETGELDPNLLPDWLRTGETKSQEAGDEPAEEMPPWLQDSLDNLKDKNLPRLEDLTAEKQVTDDLPDWLVGGSDSDPIIANPEAISTELYLDLVSKAEEGLEDKSPIDVTDAHLPDWLSEANKFPDTGKLESDVVDAPPETSEAGSAKDAFEMPAWLSAMTESDTDSGSEGEHGTDLTSLTELLSTPETQEPEPQQSDSEGFTDWLSSSSNTEDEPPAPAQEDQSADLTDWLSDSFAMEGEPVKESKDTGSSLTDWLSPPDQSSQMEQAEAETGLTEEDKPGLTDWLSELNQLTEEEGGTSSLDIADAPDWLMEEFSTSEPEEPAINDTSANIADEIAHTLMADSENVPTDFADLFQVDTSDSEGLPDWLADVAASGSTLIAAEDEEDPSQALDGLFDKEEFAAQSELDWLMQTGGLSLPDGPKEQLDIPEELMSDSPVEEGFDWLSDLASLDTNTLKSTETADETIFEENEEIEIPLDESEQIEEVESNAASATNEGKPGGIVAGVPEEFAGAALPDWLHGSPSEEPTAVDVFLPDKEEGETKDLPEWLHLEEDRQEAHPASEDVFAEDESGELEALINELPPPPQEQLVVETIPQWLQDLKPDDSKSKDLTFIEEPMAEEPEQKEGPLAGLRGVINIEPVITQAYAGPNGLHLTTTVEQQQQVALLRQLAQRDYRSSDAKVGTIRPATPAWLRILLVLMLIAAVVGGLLSPVSFTQTPDSLPEVDAVVNAINDAAGEPVLVAFEYSPGMSGELTPQAERILAQLSQNGSPILGISQYTAGTAMAEDALLSVSGTNLGYLPGEAVGLRQLSDCLDSNPGSCESLPGWTKDNAIQELTSNVKLIIVLTGHRDSFVYWVEQVAGPTEIPMIAGVTQSLGPVTMPYLSSGQLAGVIAGAPATAVYTQLTNPENSNSPLQKQINAQTFAQLLTAILLLIGMITYGIVTPITNRSGNRSTTA